MENFILNQIAPTLRHVPASLIWSYFHQTSNKETEEIAKKVGFIKGICHPGDDLDKVREANLQWTRIDIPFPYSADNVLSDSYNSFKERCLKFKENGIKVMAVTPYPQEYIAFGIDPREKKNYAAIEEIARFMITDLQGYVDGLQITNEMGIPRFTLPLKMSECAPFIGIQAKAMYPLRKNIIIGYNSAGPQTDLNILMKPYLPYIDYVGIDIYMGCFFFGTMWMFDALIRYLWEFTGKPIILCEFGYISGGAPKTKAEKKEIVRSYGAKDKKDAKRNIEKYVDALPKTMREYVKKCAQAPERYYNYIFHSEFTNHFFRELPRLTVIPGYPHTAQGQADFYRDIIPRLRKFDFLCGMFIYCWTDSDKCYVCGQNDCPTETRWGLVNCEGKEKPSFYAVKEAFKD